ncbi:MAG TPA: SLBB domain-containing protein, partial [Rectinemataceae bacterium]|nr:SLBB domain-containing protein [Rectinemataceae bacterium]
ELTRLKDDGSYEYLTFAPKDVLEKKFDLALRARDSIRLVKKTAFGGALAASDLEKFADVVQLTGQVARPELYALRPGMKLSQIVTLDQILLSTNLYYAEVVRFKTNGRDEYVIFKPSDVLSGAWDLELGPRDLVRIYKVNYSPEKPDFDRFAASVLMSGPLRFSGLYAWRSGTMLSELQGAAQLLLDVNQVYADILRVLPDGKSQLITFAPREVASGTFDTELSARDTVRYYSITQATPKIATVSLKEEAGQTTPAAVPTGTIGTVGANGAPPAALAAGGAVGAPASGITTDAGFFLEVVNTVGQIRYGGPYARTPTLRLSSVVTADQILQDTNLDYAELTRRKSDGGWEYATFSPREVLSGAYDLPLRAQDVIRYFKVGYLPEKPDFDHFGNAYALAGRARNSGLYSINAPALLSEIITSSQLVSDTDIYYAEIDRWVTGGRIEYLTFSPLAVISGSVDMRVFPRDIIRLVPAGNRGETHDFSKYADTVILQGTVRYPGRYAWYRGFSLSGMLSETDLLIDTDSSYAVIKRKSSETESLIGFSPSEIVKGNKDIELRPRDTVMLFPKYSNRPVTISGEIVEPKVIPYYEGIELSVVLRSVALMADSSSLKAVVTKAAGGSVDVYLEEYLHRQANTKVPLQPGDSISIKRLLPDEHLSIVMVRGAVKDPQPVEFREGMRLAEALAAAGGFETRAYPAGLVLIRKNAAELQQKQVDRLIAQLEAMSSASGALPTSTDSTLSSAAAIIANLQIDFAMQKAKLGSLKQQYKEGFGRISLDVPDTLAALSDSSSNVVLERDDLIFVPSMPTYVLVSGEVSDQTVIAYRSGITVREALSESGWISRDADLARIYIVRVTGKLDSTTGKGFLFFKPSILKYKLNPGDTIIVPAKTVKVSVGWSYLKDTFSVISTILTTALTTKTLLGL